MNLSEYLLYLKIEVKAKEEGRLIGLVEGEGLMGGGTKKTQVERRNV